MPDASTCRPPRQTWTARACWIAQAEAARQAAAAERQLPATRDAHTVAIGANIIRAEQVASALEQGAEGVGLMRTGILFLERHDTPGEDEQFARLSRHAGRACRPTAGSSGRWTSAATSRCRSTWACPWRKTLPGRARRAPAARRPDLLEPPTARTLPRRRAGDLSIMLPYDHIAGRTAPA